MRRICVDDGDSVTLVTDWLTCTTISFERSPSTVTLRRAEPAPVPVTTPVRLTLATARLLDCHTTWRLFRFCTTRPVESMTTGMI